MADGNDGWLSVSDMARELRATDYSIGQAIEALGLNQYAKRDITDRRRIIYPPGSLEKIKDWLERP